MAQDRNAADVAFIKALADLLKEGELHEIEVKREYGESDKLNVRVSKGGTQIVQTMQMPAAPSVPVPPTPPSPPGSGGGIAEPPADPASHPGALTSPMVGTVYMAAEPGAAPFVKVGDRVSEGQTVLIIEAMKTMNQIPASRAGVVKRLLVDDATPVEFGTPLMIIE